jgi:hypothetical protein
MSESGEIRFVPAVEPQMTTEGLTWLADINKRLKLDGVTPDIAKAIIINTNAIYVPPDTQAEVWSKLASHYGLPLVGPGAVNEIAYQNDIHAAVDLERFDIDPHAAIAAYKTHQWVNELGPFLEDPYYEQYVRIDFHSFVGTAKAAVTFKKANELMKDVPQWTLRWLEAHHTNTLVLREFEERRRSMIDKILTGTKFVNGISFIDKNKWNDMLTMFLATPIAQLLDQNSEIAVGESSMDFNPVGPILVPKGK